MTTDSQAAHGDSQAKRLEAAVAQIAAIVQQPANAHGPAAAPRADEWNVSQALGHCSEMIPYWLSQCKILIAASGAQLPRFGRSIDDEGRLAGPNGAAAVKPEKLLAQLQAESQRGAAAIRALTSAERAKQGANLRGETLSVEDIVERFVVSHAEAHAAQIDEILRRQP